jgi:hypothetical protein
MVQAVCQNRRRRAERLGLAGKFEIRSTKSETMRSPNTKIQMEEAQAAAAF